MYHKCNGLASVFGGSLDKSTAAAGAELLPAFSVGGSGISSALYPAAVGNIIAQLLVIQALKIAEIRFTQGGHELYLLMGIDKLRCLNTALHRACNNDIRIGIFFFQYLRNPLIAKRFISPADVSSFKVARRFTVANKNQLHLAVSFITVGMPHTMRMTFSECAAI